MCLGAEGRSIGPGVGKTHFYLSAFLLLQTLPAAVNLRETEQLLKGFFFVTLFLVALNVLSSTCCFTFNNKKIALQKLKSYRNTSSQCTQKAVM